MPQQFPGEESMNLIQQAVERANHLERQGKLVMPAVPTGPHLAGTNISRIQPSQMRGLPPVLAAAGVATLALGCGALLYFLLVKFQGGANRPSDPAAAVTVPSLPAVKSATAPAAPLATTTATIAAAEPVATAVAVATATAEPAATEPAAAEPAPTASAGVSLPVLPIGEPVAEVRDLVERWAGAWSSRDVAAYLGLYGEGFAPGNGLSRQAWEKSRRQMIERRRSIRVTVKDLRIQPVSEDQIVARFAQDYQADSYREAAAPKELVMVREKAGWRIVAENSAPKTPTP
jgi:ketosteroid isomerase-like protein